MQYSDRRARPPGIPGGRLLVAHCFPGLESKAGFVFKIKLSRWNCCEDWAEMVMLDVPPAASAAWIAEQAGEAPSKAEECRRQVALRLEDLSRELMLRFCDQPTVQHEELYVRRMWSCLDYHWRREAAVRRTEFAQLLTRVRAGAVAVRSAGADLLSDVALAQALEFKQRKAANHFELHYMPFVRRAALRVGGVRAQDLVENFAAELILPREGRRAADRSISGTNQSGPLAASRGRESLPDPFAAAAKDAFLPGRRRDRPTDFV